MFKKSLVMIIMLVTTLFTVSGCGNDSTNQTNGSILLDITATDLTGGRYEVAIVATYSNPTSLNLSGLEIGVNTRSHTLTGTPVTTSDVLRTDNSGKVYKFLYVNQTTEVIYVDVSANTGGLSQAKSVGIPGI